MTVNNVTGRIPRVYEHFKLQGRKKQTNMAYVEQAITAINKSICWPADAGNLAMKRFSKNNCVCVFAVSPNHEILGYTLAMEDKSCSKEGKHFYITYLAVRQDCHRKGIGNALLLRIFEKIIKKGGILASLDFTETGKLNQFYQNPRIPYYFEIDKNFAYLAGEEINSYYFQNAIQYFLTKKRRY